MGNESPIGVFDSGVGGLTVLKALTERLPGEDFVYLGDTARLPYGTKSVGSVTAYALQSTRLLVSKGVKALVVACNTASSVALKPIALSYPHIPVIGVVQPGALAGVKATRRKVVAVVGTESTVNGGAYPRAIAALSAEIKVVSRACSLFVALAEEGWTQGRVVEEIAARYLNPLFQGKESRPDCIILGCTHFPVLKDAISRVVGPDVIIVDSAKTTAFQTECALLKNQISGRTSGGKVRFFATDDAARFARVGRYFLGREIEDSEVEIVDL